jgi:ribosome-associated protein
VRLTGVADTCLVPAKLAGGQRPTRRENAASPIPGSRWLRSLAFRDGAGGELSRTMEAVRIIEVTISTEAIGLGQFLKLAGLAVGGSDAKVMIELGWVSVNGRVEAQLGRQLRPGDVVAAGGRSARVVTADQGPVNR